VSERRLVAQESVDAFAQLTGEQAFGHLDAEC
jgi:acyl dehydratase